MMKKGKKILAEEKSGLAVSHIDCNLILTLSRDSTPS